VEGGGKTEKNPCKQKGFEKKYMHQTCLKWRRHIFKKNIHTQLTTWKKNANIKNLPHHSHHFSNGPSLIMSLGRVG
jgi:hypothetical protein